MFAKISVLIIVIIVLIGLTGSGLYGIFSNRTNPFQTESSAIGATASLEIAQNWILSNSPTYLFDGSNLKYIETVELNCFDCYGFTFTFDSAHAQVITSHTINIATKEGVVIQATLDAKYDEIREELILTGTEEILEPE